MADGGASAPDELRARGFAGELVRDAPLGPHTTWRIGGPAELLATPKDVEDIRRALSWAVERGVPWRILGNGSNLLVRDEGVPGLVLRLRRVLDRMEIDGTRVVAGSGLSFPVLARRTAARGLCGLEFGAGIPATVGGAVVMNAGWHEHELGNFVCSVEWLDPTSDEVGRFDRHECRFGYRRSRFRDTAGGVVLSVELELVPGDARRIQQRLESFASSRKANQPTELPSCGSVFLKPPGDFAGRLIEEAGMKGLRVGDIQVSPRHANFFVNLGSGRAADVLTLVDRVEGEVLRRFGVRLVREFELW